VVGDIVGGRASTTTCAALLAVLLGVLGTSLPVPLVALGPGPTYDTLGDVDGAAVVTVAGLPTYPTSGHLNMTTVAVSDRLTLVDVLRAWASGRRQVVPRSQVFAPGKTDDQVRDENTQQFATSETNAELAALTQLAIPTRVVVGAVVPDSPAAGALRAGDELVTVSGRSVASPSAVAEALAGTTPGQSITVTYRRDGQDRSAALALGASADRRQGLLGVRPAVEPRSGDVTISLGDIGGPSAGLMFALAVVDKLSPGPLTGGRFVAGTGAIDGAGRVSPIGGIPFKMRAARDAGATVFLVPDANCAEAAANTPDGLRLVRVTALDDAVRQLRALDAGTPTASC
jgi:PDZ domain-containing protein